MIEYTKMSYHFYTRHFHEQEEKLTFELTEKNINLLSTAVTLLAGTSWGGESFNPTVTQFFLRNQ